MARLYWRTYIALPDSDPYDVLVDDELHERLGVMLDELIWTVVPSNFGSTPVVYTRENGRELASAAAVTLAKAHPLYADRIRIHLVDHYELNPFPEEVVELQSLL